MNKPDISPNFTVEDIHIIREYNWEQTKNLSEAERTSYYKNKAMAFLKEAGIVPQKKVYEYEQVVM
ncbi:MAG: hypothetical protein IIU15_05030 [Treponema sp.]|nr:hypothetical protein [Treponema sp.]